MIAAALEAWRRLSLTPMCDPLPKFDTVSDHNPKVGVVTNTVPTPNQPELH